MASAVSVGARASAPRRSRASALASRRAADALAAGGVALTVGLAARSHGAYEPRAWASLGLVLVVSAAVLLVRDRRVAPLVGTAAALLAALGLWALASVAWGGLPGEGLAAFDRALVAAAALLLGSLLAASGRASAVAAGTLAGLTAVAVELVVRAGLTPEAALEQFRGRVFEGSVGYHNGQAALLAAALPLALWAACLHPVLVRALGGAAAGLFGAVILLTQSRAGLAAAVLAVAVQALLVRRLAHVATAAVLGASLAALSFPLRRVDEAMLAGGGADQIAALRNYVLWSVVVAAAVALAAALVGLRTRPLLDRRSAAVLVAILVVAGAAGAVATGAAGRAGDALAELTSDAPPLPEPGELRISALSLNGRLDAWRVALHMAAEAPVGGQGQGRFAPVWAVERTTTLNILQPHSLALELLAELGAVGLAALVAALALLAVALARAPRRGLAAAALAGLVAFAAQASLDWTWSFPGLVVPVLLVAGAAAGAPGRIVRDGAARAAVVAVALVAVVALAVPALAARETARAEAATSAAAAWKAATAAERLDPWDAAAVSAAGRAAEAAGAYVVAAERYRAAAALSQRPWLEHYREARALARAGMLEASRAACRLAWSENPLEPLLRREHCAG